ncbi:HAMP domain-containing sensor histidine kinase [Flavobacterium sp. 2]|uniref:sensor histidine kinase n=1 Tax=Flavobacterium sp. 2 TaxID=308053 RepID=UPI000C18C302|nr:HAMP domain-containing sensor histidine kinase [Flavobacterium sp. 2]PIF60421.1 signal transduction histidine kinase [Flavobacterium sp. 2]
MTRLNYRYTKAYSLVTFFVLLIGFSIVYTAVKRSASQATIGELKHLNAIIAKQIESGCDFTEHNSRKNVAIQSLTEKNAIETVKFKVVWSEELQDNVTEVCVTTTHKINNKYYGISSHTFMIITNDIYLNGIFMVFAWTFIFLTSMVIVLSEVISGYFLSPFNATLRSVKKFTINQKANIKLEKTNTLEFQELNRFLKKMTKRAQKDFIAQKEFSENASHELQTPIAVIKAKIELLLQSNLDEEQLVKLTSMLEELEKLSKINQSLTLLIKLENFENKENCYTDISALVEETNSFFSDLIEMKNIRLTKNIKEGVLINMDENLARILLNNLFSNAIRHNFAGGEIIIEISDLKLKIKNTGYAPSVPIDELFGRFKKGNQSLDSIGIGLAIAKKICEIFDHSIHYYYISSFHILEIKFFKKSET